MQSTEPNGATSWMVWGEIQKALGRLEATMHANRQATIDQGAAMRQRQDDMRRELLGHIGLLHKRLEKNKSRSSPVLGWLSKHLPWDRVVTAAISILGMLGIIRPSWLSWLKMLGG